MDLAEVVLQDLDGNDVRLGSVWEEGPAVLVFLRHYGWVFCREHAVQLHRDREEFSRLGVSLVVIGQGTPAHARAFVDDQGVSGLRLLVDEDRAAYRAAGASKSGVMGLVGPKVALRAAKAVASERVMQGRVIGSASQLGGVVVVAQDGSVAWSHLASDAGDNPPNSVVLDAARAAVAAA